MLLALSTVFLFASGFEAAVVFNATTKLPTIISAVVTEVTVNVTEIPIVNATIWNGTIVAVDDVTIAPNFTAWDTPIVQFFTKVVHNKLFGAHYCKTDAKCGVGLTCNLFWNLCVPAETPAFVEIEKTNCTVDTDCTDMHHCLHNACRFCGPRTCRTNLDCCSGLLNNLTFECVDIEHLEKHSLATQLGRPTHTGGSHNSHEEIESEEMLTFGAAAQGDTLFHHKRCWARCTVDEDCNYSGWPEALHDGFFCISGFCLRKEARVTLPANFTAPTPIVPRIETKTITKTKKMRTEKKEKKH